MHVVIPVTTDTAEFADIRIAKAGQGCKSEVFIEQYLKQSAWASHTHALACFASVPKFCSQPA